VASDLASEVALEDRGTENESAELSQRGRGEVDADVIDDGPGGAAVDFDVLDDIGPLPEQMESTEGERMPPTFELEMTVSSGTYVRSVVHDLGISVKSAAHVVVLTRLQQGRFVLDTTRYPAPRSGPPAVADGGEQVSVGREGWPCVDWGVLEKAVVKWEADAEIEVDDDGWAEWELEILNKWPNQAELTTKD
jgi:tRNA pseudouridine55 synthase